MRGISGIGEVFRTYHTTRKGLAMPRGVVFSGLASDKDCASVRCILATRNYT